MTGLSLILLPQLLVLFPSHCYTHFLSPLGWAVVFTIFWDYLGVEQICNGVLFSSDLVIYISTRVLNESLDLAKIEMN